MKSPVFAAILFLGAIAAAEAQTTPRLIMEQSTPQGAGNVLTINRVPVVAANGAVTYRDVTFEFLVSNTGVVTVKPGFPQIVNSPVLTTGNFIAGRYKLAGTYYRLAGPGAAGSGRTSWSLNKDGTACLDSAGWTTGLVTGHPMQGRLNAARITFSGYAYGALGSYSCWASGIPAYWYPGDLIGVAASGNGLTIFNYTLGSSTDASSPKSSISFQRCLNAACT
jgi:hypothetical protein